MFPNSGFMDPGLGESGLGIVPISRSVFSRSITSDVREKFDRIQRGDFGGVDPQQAMYELNMAMMEGVLRAQNLAGVPVREDLEAEVSSLIPVQTPLRNRLPRSVGSGSASTWEQETSLGGGYGVKTTVTLGASSATQTVGDTRGMQAGTSLYFAVTNAYRTVQSVTNSTTVVLTSTISTTTGESVSAGPFVQPGQDPSAQAFFSESGAPSDVSPTYAKKTATYKLLGTMFSITGLAMAAGASFDNQLALEKTAAIRRLMLMEENALINADSTIVTAPFGDGTNALAYDGMIKLISTANGTPAAHVQVNVGALTTAHIDSQLTRVFNQGGNGQYILVNGQEALSLVHLAEGSGTIIRVMATADADAPLGLKVTGYKHPITGEIVPILVSRFVPAGTMIFGSDYLADGKVAMDVRVLPQVQLPELAPNVNIQGYVAQEVAPAATSPQKYPGIVSVYSVPRMKGATVFAISTGLTPV